MWTTFKPGLAARLPAITEMGGEIQVSRWSEGQDNGEISKGVSRRHHREGREDLQLGLHRLVKDRRSEYLCDDEGLLPLQCHNVGMSIVVRQITCVDAIGLFGVCHKGCRTTPA